MRMPRPTRLIVIGAGIMVLGFGYDMTFAGLPYQDPPPDLQASWELHKSIAEWAFLAGLSLAMLGVALALVPFARWCWNAVRSR